MGRGEEHLETTAHNTININIIQAQSTTQCDYTTRDCVVAYPVNVIEQQPDQRDRGDFQRGEPHHADQRDAHADADDVVQRPVTR